MTCALADESRAAEFQASPQATPHFQLLEWQPQSIQDPNFSRKAKIHGQSHRVASAKVVADHGSMFDSPSFLC